MNKQEYNELTEQAITLILSAINDPELKDVFENGMKIDFRALPKCKETIRTLKGIIGYYAWCEEKGKKDSFLFNALHDISECSKNYLESWFSPRLGRYADYQPFNTLTIWIWIRKIF